MRKFLIRKKTLIAGILTASTVTLLAIFSLLPVPFISPPDTTPVEDTNNLVDLGITYLRITPEVAAYYGLDVDSGLLVTEVKSGSVMDSVDVEIGDIICSCNGVVLDNNVSFIGILRKCSPDDKFTFEVCRGEDYYSIECCQNCGTSECSCGCSSTEDD